MNIQVQEFPLERLAEIRITVDYSTLWNFIEMLGKVDTNDAGLNTLAVDMYWELKEATERAGF